MNRSLDIQLTPVTTESSVETTLLPDTARTVRYAHAVSRDVSERVIASIKRLADKDPEEEIALFVSCPGGPTGVGLSFYDSMRYLIRPRLVTIGSGDVDSAGIIVFLTGDRRYVTSRTTALLHPAGRMFGEQRYTVREMEAMLREDKIKDEQYAAVVAQASGGRLTVERVHELMEAHTVLSPDDMVRYGLAHGVLP